MTDAIIILVVLVIVGAISFYLYRQKKRGVTCIGCPDGAKCTGSCKGCSAQCSCKDA